MSFYRGDIGFDKATNWMPTLHILYHKCFFCCQTVSIIHCHTVEGYIMLAWKILKTYFRLHQHGESSRHTADYINMGNPQDILQITSTWAILMT